MLLFVIFYLTLAIYFVAHFSACFLFDQPVILNSFNSFSSYTISLLAAVVCFDFVINDNLYFFNQNLQLLFVFIILGVMLVTSDYIGANKHLKPEYDLLLLFVLIGGICICFCDEFLMLYLAIELQSLTLYVFATFNRNSEFSTEAGLKYFIFGGLMSCLLLLGFCFVYLYFGSVSFDLIRSIVNFSANPLFFCGFIFIIVLFLFKLGSAPFHL